MKAQHHGNAYGTLSWWQSIRLEELVELWFEVKV